jgi:hypothetical protein
MIVLIDEIGPRHFSQDNMHDRGYQSAPLISPQAIAF